MRAPGSSIGVDIQQEYLGLRLHDMFFGSRGHSRTDGSSICDMNAEFLSWFYKWRIATSDVPHSGRLNLTNARRICYWSDGVFLDDFEVKGKASELAWSPYFEGGEGQGFDQTQITFMTHDTTRGPEDKGEGQFVDGLTVRFGLVWEEKHESDQTGMDDWETFHLRGDQRQPNFSDYHLGCEFETWACVGMQP
ncbi:hypothetical protein DL765_004990 [Monosporascus sp. GIB2]|nr:hypothetical protein DL765_004990 [Monosporascus sp. GIB2]